MTGKTPAAVVRKRATAVSEDYVSRMVKLLLRPWARRIDSNEAGFMGHFDTHTADIVERVGGTRTTPGIPDIEAMMANPFDYRLTVEVKGTTTPVRLPQWQYAEDAALGGHPHLLVRSQEALITGLRFLGLLPSGWERFLPMPHDLSVWPENVNFLAPLREKFWAGRPETCPGYAVQMAVPFSPRLPMVGKLPRPVARKQVPKARAVGESAPPAGKRLGGRR